MKKILLSILACCLCAGAFADEGDKIYTTGDPSFEAVELANGTVAITKIWTSKTEITIPATIWSNVDPYPSYSVSTVGNGYQIYTNNEAGTSTLTTIKLSEGITSIGAQAFTTWSKNTTLQYLQFPSTLISIGNYAFQACDGLSYITSYSNAISLGTEVFKGYVTDQATGEGWDAIVKNCTVQVPDGTTWTGYKTDTYSYWDEFAKNNKIIEESTLSMSTLDYATYYNTYGYTMPEGLEGYAITGMNNGYAVLTKLYSAGDQVCNGIALLLKSTEILSDSKTFYFYALSSGGNTAEWPSGLTNLLNGTQTEQEITPYNGNYYYYKLANDETNGLGWYWGATGGGVFTNGAHKAYLAVQQSSGARSFIGFDETTGISGVNVSAAAARNGKFVESGRVVIVNNNKKFNVNGQEVK